MNDRKLWEITFHIQGGRKDIPPWQIWHYTRLEAQKHVKTYAAREYGVYPDDVTILSLKEIQPVR